MPDAVKEERRAQFMAVQARISAARLARRVDTSMPVLIDSIDKAQNVAIARSAADAPEIDGTVRVERGGALAVGAFAKVRITGAGEHDLTAHVTR